MHDSVRMTSKTTKTFAEFIVSPVTYEGAKNYRRPIISYLSRHISDLVNTFIQTESVVQRDAAFRIMILGNYRIAEQISNCDVFKSYATHVITTTQDPLEITRIASVWRNCVMMTNELIMPELVISVLNFVDMPAVESLLEDMCKSLTVDDLEQCGIANCLISHEKFELLQILPRDLIETPLVITAVTESSSPKKWGLMNHLITADNAKLFARQAFDAVCELGDVFGPTQEKAVLFLSKLLRYYPLISDEIDVEGLTVELVNLYQWFPNHSIALQAINKLVCEMVSIDNTKYIVLNHFIPIIHERVFSEASTTARSHAIDCALMIRDAIFQDALLSEHLQSNYEWQEITERAKSFDEAIHTQWYGGSVGPDISSAEPHFNFECRQSFVLLSY